MPDVETSQYPLEVIISSRTPSAELTAAFHRPSLLQSSGSFVDQYLVEWSGPPSRTVLLVGQELDKRSAFWVLFTAVAFSICIGLIVGFACSRADLAIATSSGLMTVVSTLTGLFLWMSK
jgi:hypothetical protein